MLGASPFGDPLKSRRRNHATKRAGYAEAGIICHDQKNGGAPFGGTTRAGQYGFESAVLRPIFPSNFCGSGGSCLPLIVVVALAEPGTPVTCCANTVPTANPASDRVVSAIWGMRAV